jgi:FkbM family methyltransferase
MRTNTKTLFAALIKRLDVDCVCDIGSRDGDQSLLFRHLLPSARVMAFEANPINFEMMRKDPRLAEAKVELFSQAIAAEVGTAEFHIADVDYSDPLENRGMSSMLRMDKIKVQRTVQVPTDRIDTFLEAHGPELRHIALWIDVEGMEYGVLQGLSEAREKVVAIHVETAQRPIWKGQRNYDEVRKLLFGLGFQACGTNMRRGDDWGDVVFLQNRAAARLGWQLGVCRLRAWASHWLKADHAAVFLRARAPRLYHFMRRLYLKLGT